MWYIFEEIWVDIVHVYCVKSRRLVSCDRFIFVRTVSGRVSKLSSDRGAFKMPIGVVSDVLMCV